MSKFAFLFLSLILLLVIPFVGAVSQNDSDIYSCTTDEYCQVNNLGSDCTNGVCAYVSQPYEPPETCFGFFAIFGILSCAIIMR